MNSRIVILFTILTAGIILPLSLQGKNPPAGPREILRERDETIRAIVTQEDTAEKKIRSQLRKLINEIMDFPDLARRSLGQHWEQLSSKDRRLFSRLFQELIELTSTKKLDIFKANHVEYPEESVLDEKAEVKSIVSKGREQIEVIYLLHRVKGEWKVYDMIIDELGLAENYRTQFNKIIQQNKFSGLIQRLRERIQEEKAEAEDRTQSE